MPLDYSSQFITNEDFANKDLRNANFNGATAVDIDFNSANLEGSTLNHGTFGESNFTKANLSNSSITHSTFLNSNLTLADFSNATIRNSLFAEANLQLAKFCNCNLSGTSFTNANLSHANLTGAKLSFINFRGANLIGANFSGAEIDKLTNFKDAQFVREPEINDKLGFGDDLYEEIPLWASIMRDELNRLHATVPNVVSIRSAIVDDIVEKVKQLPNDLNHDKIKMLQYVKSHEFIKDEAFNTDFFKPARENENMKKIDTLLDKLQPKVKREPRKI